MIPLASRGRAQPGGLQRLVLKLAIFIRRAFEARVTLIEGPYRSVYQCENLFDAMRPMSLWTKEEGTMRWIDAEVHAGDVFMDVGANIGIYTIAAAHRVGQDGVVCAFEPHKANALTLMRNLALSGLSDRVLVFACALSDEPGVERFNYSSLTSASSGSQLGHRRNAGREHDFQLAASEMMLATTVDHVIASGQIPAPTLVKIDVDGNELKILCGMRMLLTGTNRPRSVQVELNVGVQHAIVAFLESCNYRLAERHFTAAGKKRSARGAALEKIAHNAIFQRVEPD